MRPERFKQSMWMWAVLLLLLCTAAGPAFALTANLCTGTASVTMADGTAVDVWGFGLDPTGSGACAVTIPGPTLRVDPAAPTLTVNLRNTLDRPVSLHILGQQLSNNGGPVWDGGASGARPDPTNPTLKVRSFTHEAAANGGAAAYTWNAFRPGSYLLQSATMPGVQVAMGLSAPVIMDSGVGEAYPGIAYDQELVLVYQEIDADLHADPDNFTIVYREPEYFLVNGMSYPAPGLNPVNEALPVDVGNRLLIRFINAGGDTHMPHLLGDDMTVVAEDGNPKAYGQPTYSFELNAAKTVDAVYEPQMPGRLALFDGGLKLTNAASRPGGMLAYLNVGGTAVGGDTVTIDNVVYDAGSQNLTVVATSSAQPGVSLTAEGYGALGWKSWLNLYRSTFTGVASQPASILVTSSGGGSATWTAPAPDTVTIENVIYDAGAQTLTVVATSSDQPTVALTAETYGALGWKAAKNFYRNTFTGVASVPASVTVTSSGGGSATWTAPAPDTVTIENVIYDAGAQTLTVVATSSDQPNVALTAETYGALGWKSWLNFYRTTFTGVATQPASVTVTSSGGGSATWMAP